MAQVSDGFLVTAAPHKSGNVVTTAVGALTCHRSRLRTICIFVCSSTFEAYVVRVRAINLLMPKFLALEALGDAPCPGLGYDHREGADLADLEKVLIALFRFHTDSEDVQRLSAHRPHLSLH